MVHLSPRFKNERITVIFSKNTILSYSGEFFLVINLVNYQSQCGLKNKKLISYESWQSNYSKNLDSGLIEKAKSMFIVKATLYVMKK
jgi:hypothetical protein